MRQVATFDDERSARLFADVLCARAIDTDVSKSRNGVWDVWVLEEKHVEASRAAYAAFDANPAAPEHLEAAGCNDRKARQQVVVERKSRHEVIDVRRRFPGTDLPFGRLTLALAVLSVVVTLLVTVAHRRDVFDALAIGPSHETTPFASVLSGQVWRLITPIFMHFSILHIVFNMWWFVDLGSALESRLGARRYAAIIFLSAAFSNAVQYWWIPSQAFGGMSGVLYALFGYVWVRGRLDPTIGLAMPNATVVALLIWMALGMTGAFANVANGCHVGGLVIGAALGALAAARARL